MVSIKHVVSVLLFEFAALLSLVLIIYWVQYFGGGLKWEGYLTFNYHPVFMIIASTFLMGHSLITYRILPISHRAKMYIHAAMSILAAISAIVGLTAVIEFHNDKLPFLPKLYSLHSWIGIAALAFLFLQALGGVAIFQDLCRGASGEIRGAYKPIHVALGSGMVILLVAAITTGLQEHYMTRHPAVDAFSDQAYILNFLALSVVLWGMTVVYILTTCEKLPPQEAEAVVQVAPAPKTDVTAS